MKLNAQVKGFLFSVLFMILAFAVYFIFLAKKNEYLVDNPTNTTYFFNLNNTGEKIITAGQQFPVQLQKGKNQIKVYDAGKKMLYDSLFTVEKPRGLLNIAHQDYYIHNQYYGFVENKDSLLLAHQFEIDGEKFLGDVKHINRLYSEDFYYNLNEDYDQVIKNIQKIESRTKIYRKEDFIQFYKENY